MASISPAEAISGVGVLLMAFFVVLATRTFRRTQGRVWKFHVVYCVIVAAIAGLCPLSVKQIVFGKLGGAVAGIVYPLWESLRALCSPATADDMEWLSYWCAAGAMYCLSAYFTDYTFGESSSLQLVWFQFEFFFFIWLYLPFTDGATLVFDTITRPFLSPLIDPLTKQMNSWINGIISTIINASHLWFLWIFFILLPQPLKRFVTIMVGTIYPFLASVTAVTTIEKEDDTFWLTYWACYGVLFLILDWTETWLGIIPGYYTLFLMATVYLMLPMTQGAEKVFRYILVPLAGLKESLILRDAILLKKDLIKSLPIERQATLRELITYSFNIETPDDDCDHDNSHHGDGRMEIGVESAKLILSDTRKRLQAMKPWNKTSQRLSRTGDDDDNTTNQQQQPTESTSLV